MAIKRRLTAIRLDKIAAVDKPCQQHATVAIIKRAPAAPVGPKAIAKATFQEALEGNMIAGAVNEAFYQSFDGLWERNDAFRAALTDEFAEGGDGTIASAAYVASVKQLVDDAVAAAREAGATASDTTEIEKTFTKAATAWLESKEPTDMIIKNAADLKDAIAKFDPTKNTVADVVTIHTAAKSLGLESELPVAGPLAKAAAPVNDETVALKRENAVLKLAPSIRKHFDSLDAAKQDAFLAKSATDQAAEVEAIEKGDPVLYTTVSGIVIRKSDGAVAAALAEQNDQLAKSVKTLTDTLGGESITKRAAEFNHLPNAESIIKAADLMPEADRAAYLDTMRAANKAAGGAFQRIGSAGGGVLDPIEKGADSPEGKMDAIVKRIAKEDKTDEATATVKAATTDAEYQALYMEQLATVPAVGGHPSQG